MKEVDDIWAGGSIKKCDEPFHYDANAARLAQNIQDAQYDNVMGFIKVTALAIALILVVYFSICGPSMWHNALVVCTGNNNCVTYTDWKVINENSKTGVLEVWAGGRLQRLSNGTWRYE